MAKRKRVDLPEISFFDTVHVEKPVMEEEIKLKVNPYADFKKWLMYAASNVRLKDPVIKALNNRAILSSFSSLGGISIFLNKWFNNYDLTKLDKEEFCNFIKELVIKYNIDVYKDLSFFKQGKTDEDINDLQNKLPYLKKYEISNLLVLIENDPEYDSFMDYLGLQKYKKQKREKNKKE